MKKRKSVLVLLASQSVRRREILTQEKIPFKIIRSVYEEIHSELSAPSRHVILHAKGKVKHAVIPEKYREGNKPRTIIMGADTLVYFRGKLLGKPKSFAHAAQMLKRMMGRSHTVYTGLALRDVSTGQVKAAYAKSRVWFKKWPEDKIRRYVRAVNSLDKAGAYAIQMKPSIAEKYEGSLSNIIGLPVELLRKMLRSF